MAVLEREWIAVVEHEEYGDASAAVLSACIDCGRLRDNAEWFLDRPHGLMLRARVQVGATGSWKKLGLPRFDEIGAAVGSSDVVFRTLKRRRFHEMYQNMTAANLEGLVRKALTLPPNLWPYGVRSAAWDASLVIHHGLPIKFARKRDRAHLFLVSYTPDAIKYPTEVWLGTHRGRPRLRFLKKLSVAYDVHNLLVCADPYDSIVTTSYIIDPRACDASREGALLYAAWASPTARLSA